MIEIWKNTVFTNIIDSATEGDDVSRVLAFQKASELSIDSLEEAEAYVEISLDWNNVNDTDELKNLYNKAISDNDQNYEKKKSEGKDISNEESLKGLLEKENEQLKKAIKLVKYDTRKVTKEDLKSYLQTKKINKENTL